MDKRSFPVRSILFILAGVVACVSLFRNWFPANLDLGVIQLEEVFGTVNPFTLRSILVDLESELGLWAEFLPQGFEELKTWSMVLMVTAGAAVLLYVTGSVQILSGKRKYHNLVACGAAGAMIAAAVLFRSLLEGIYDVTGIQGASEYALSVVSDSPYGITLLCAIVSVVGSETVCSIVIDLVVQIGMSITNSVMHFVQFVKTWVEVILGNAGYLAADLIGGCAAYFIGAWVVAMTDSVLAAVFAGLLAGGLLAVAGCYGVWAVFMRHRAEA